MPGKLVVCPTPIGNLEDITLRTRRALHDGDWDLDDLRTAAADLAGIDPPALERLRRVTWGSVAIVLLLGFVVYALIGAIANVGLQTLIDELKQADTTWLLAALLFSPVIQVAQAFSTMGASVLPVRFVPVLMLEYAIGFIALAVPSSAARVAFLLWAAAFVSSGKGLSACRWSSTPATDASPKLPSALFNTQLGQSLSGASERILAPHFRQIPITVFMAAFPI